MLRRVDLRHRNGGLVGNTGQIASAVTGREQASQGTIDIIFANQSSRQCLLVAVAQSRRIAEGIAVALIVGTRFHRRRDRRGAVRRIFMAIGDILDGIAVGNNVALKAPGSAQMIFQQQIVGAGWLAIDAVIRAHDRSGLRFDDRRPEGRQIGIFQVMGRYEYVGDVAGRFRPRVNGKVLRSRNDVRQVGVVALHARDEGNTHPGCQVRIFAVGFLAPAPSRVAEDVDVGRPGIEAGSYVAEVSGLAAQGMKGANLDADRRGDIMNHWCIE